MTRITILPLLVCLSCVPYQQQLLESEQAEIEGYIGPLVIDEEKFYQVASSEIFDKATIPEEYLPTSNYYTYDGTIAGERVYIRDCKCFRDVKIIQNKLVVTNWYGGGESNRESTVLFWTGDYYKNSKGEYIVDVILHSDIVDIRRALMTDKKIHDISDLQLENANFIWINLIGYNQLVPYTY